MRTYISLIIILSFTFSIALHSQPTRRSLGYADNVKSVTITERNGTDTKFVDLEKGVGVENYDSIPICFSDQISFDKKGKITSRKTFRIDNERNITYDYIYDKEFRLIENGRVHILYIYDSTPASSIKVNIDSLSKLFREVHHYSYYGHLLEEYHGNQLVTAAKHEYDSNGNHIKMCSLISDGCPPPDNGDFWSCIKYEYDKDNKFICKKEYSGDSETLTYYDKTTYEYNSDGWISKTFTSSNYSARIDTAIYIRGDQGSFFDIIDPAYERSLSKFNKKTFEYNEKGKLIRHEDPLYSYIYEAEYDSIGNLINVTEMGGIYYSDIVSIDYKYDNFGSCISKEHKTFYTSYMVETFDFEYFDEP